MADSQIVFQEDLEEPQIHVSEEGYSRIYQLGISNALFRKKLTEEILQYKDRVNVPGFRKGKAPISVIINRLPEQERDTYLQQLVREQIDEHLNDSDKIVLGVPEIDSDYSGKTGLAARVSVSYEVSPEVPDIDYSQYKLVKFIPQDRTQLFKQIREDFLTANPERILQESGYKSEVGDILKVDLTIEAPGTNADGFIDRGREVPVAEDSSLYGEEFNSIGLSADEEFTIDSKLPSFYEDYEFAGEPCRFIFKVHEIFKNHKLDEPTIEMAKKFGFKSIEELDEVLLERKLQQFESISTNLLKNQFSHAVKNDLNYDVPTKVLDRTMEDIWHERKAASDKSSAENPVSSQEVDKSENKTENEAHETSEEDSHEVDWSSIDPDEVTEIKDQAMKGVRYLILLKDIAKKENIKASRDEIVDEWALFLTRNYNTNVYDPAKDRSKLKFEHVPEYFVINTQNRIVQSRVETILLEKVNSVEKKVSFKRLLEIREMAIDDLHDLVESADFDQENGTGKN